MGTVLSTVTILPHVWHALRNHRPGGSTLAWALGAAGSAVWMVYGLIEGDVVMASPGIVTVPCGLLLSIWSAREQAADQRRAAALRLHPARGVPAYLQAVEASPRRARLSAAA